MDGVSILVLIIFYRSNKSEFLGLTNRVLISKVSMALMDFAEYKRHCNRKSSTVRSASQGSSTELNTNFVLCVALVYFIFI